MDQSTPNFNDYSADIDDKKEYKNFSQNNNYNEDFEKLCTNKEYVEFYENKRDSEFSDDSVMIHLDTKQDVQLTNSKEIEVIIIEIIKNLINNIPSNLDKNNFDTNQKILLYQLFNKLSYTDYDYAFTYFFNFTGRLLENVTIFCRKVCGFADNNLYYKYNKLNPNNSPDNFINSNSSLNNCSADPYNLNPCISAETEKIYFMIKSLLHKFLHKNILNDKNIIVTQNKIQHINYIALHEKDNQKIEEIYDYCLCLTDILKNIFVDLDSKFKINLKNKICSTVPRNIFNNKHISSTDILPENIPLNNIKDDYMFIMNLAEKKHIPSVSKVDKFQNINYIKKKSKKSSRRIKKKNICTSNKNISNSSDNIKLVPEKKNKYFYAKFICDEYVDSVDNYIKYCTHEILCNDLQVKSNEETNLKIISEVQKNVITNTTSMLQSMLERPRYTCENFHYDYNPSNNILIWIKQNINSQYENKKSIFKPVRSIDENITNYIISTVFDNMRLYIKIAYKKYYFPNHY